jgi:hypothetical protein
MTLLLGAPVTIFMVKRPLGFVRNIFKVMFARKTWVGYCFTESHDANKLPKLKPGVLNPAAALDSQELNTETLERLNLLYARDYKIKNDLNIILRGFRHMGDH